MALLAESEYVTAGGRPNLAALAQQLNGVSYESLRRAARGRATPSTTLIEEVARMLRLSPDYFLEYRLAQVARRLDLRTAVGRTSCERLNDLDRQRNLRGWYPSLKRVRRSSQTSYQPPTRR
jgi:hypothetical protein